MREHEDPHELDPHDDGSPEEPQEGGDTEEHAKQPHVRISGAQAFGVILAGAAMIFVGLATIFESHLFNPSLPAAAGVLFGPFALAGGALVVALGVRARRR